MTDSYSQWIGLINEKGSDNDVCSNFYISGKNHLGRDYTYSSRRRVCYGGVKCSAEDNFSEVKNVRIGFVSKQVEKNREVAEYFFKNTYLMEAINPDIEKGMEEGFEVNIEDYNYTTCLRSMIALRTIFSGNYSTVSWPLLLKVCDNNYEKAFYLYSKIVMHKTYRPSNPEIHNKYYIDKINGDFDHTVITVSGTYEEFCKSLSTPNKQESEATKSAKEQLSNDDYVRTYVCKYVKGTKFFQNYENRVVWKNIPLATKYNEWFKPISKDFHESQTVYGRIVPENDEEFVRALQEVLEMCLNLPN